MAIKITSVDSEGNIELIHVTSFSMRMREGAATEVSFVIDNTQGLGLNKIRDGDTIRVEVEY